jgi:lysozyme family protein
MTVADLIDGVIAREGGFVDHPADRGGPTKYGITQATLIAWRGRPLTREDVRDLTTEEARAIYEDRFVRQPGYDRILDERLREQVVDAAVLHGPGRATRWLQEVAGVKADGVLGPVTAGAVNRLAADLAGRRFAVHRIRFLARLVSDDPTQAVFCAGWLNRATHFLLD